ncbi:hypothetical protein Ae201684P_015775 [Aphanomyces euteiches]|nr:hypothetical protein Ae201684P_015775 [Aphanomyces euteiches]
MPKPSSRSSRRSSTKQATPPTLSHAFLLAATKYAGSPALHYQQPNGHWLHYSWNEVRYNSIQFAKALLSQGFVPGDQVAIVGGTSPSWYFAYFGCILAGGVAVGMASPSEQALLLEASARFLVVDSFDQLNALAKPCIPQLEAIGI